ncbi:hypothetical protein LCGC14_3159920 [marine sediment metagenome]|uniref:Uncharacterized protein n=1 Tax=marine sediment metagenome TaxID=412755 RepID=A0A0F8WFN1_9ZZZZ
MADSVKDKEIIPPTQERRVWISTFPDSPQGIGAIAKWRTADGDYTVSASGLDVLGATLALANELAAIIEEWELGKRRRKRARKK